jgi:hypothetical protein
MKRTGAAAVKNDGHNPTETMIEMLKQIVGHENMGTKSKRLYEWIRLLGEENHREFRNQLPISMENMQRSGRGEDNEEGNACCATNGAYPVTMT